MTPTWITNENQAYNKRTVYLLDHKVGSHCYFCFFQQVNIDFYEDHFFSMTPGFKPAKATRIISGHSMS